MWRDSGAELRARIAGAVSMPVARDAAVIGLIIAVAVGGFGLGLLAGSANSSMSPTMVSATATPVSEVIRQQLATPAGFVVASQHGTRYHFPWCSGAQRMKVANMVWYETTAAARDDGYTPAQNCPGLE